jgi:hypothetical protein
MPKHREASHALSLSQLRREVRTALELAIAALAPTPLVDELATSAGLLEALAQFPHDASPVVANSARVTQASERALEKWQQWQSTEPRRKGSA